MKSTYAVGRALALRLYCVTVLKGPNGPGMVNDTISLSERLTQEDHHEFQATLGYIHSEFQTILSHRMGLGGGIKNVGSGCV